MADTSRQVLANPKIFSYTLGLNLLGDILARSVFTGSGCFSASNRLLLQHCKSTFGIRRGCGRVGCCCEAVHVLNHFSKLGIRFCRINHDFVVLEFVWLQSFLSFLSAQIRTIPEITYLTSSLISSKLSRHIILLGTLRKGKILLA